MVARVEKSKELVKLLCVRSNRPLYDKLTFLKRQRPMSGGSLHSAPCHVSLVDDLFDEFVSSPSLFGIGI